MTSCCSDTCSMCVTCESVRMCACGYGHVLILFYIIFKLLITFLLSLVPKSTSPLPPFPPLLNFLILGPLTLYFNSLSSLAVNVNQLAVVWCRIKECSSSWRLLDLTFLSFHQWGYCQTQEFVCVCLRQFRESLNGVMERLKSEWKYLFGFTGYCDFCMVERESNWITALTRSKLDQGVVNVGINLVGYLE